MLRKVSPVLAALFLVAIASTADAQQDKIENAMAAAPAAVSGDATIMDWDETVLREGNNGWTCFPDSPDVPGDTPMCFDGQWMKWVAGWMSQTEPDVTGLGLAYMLKGGVDASNTDPFATEPPAGMDWVKSGPHVMVIVPDPSDLEGIPTDPDNGGPWVMWKGTPYAHVMMPVPGGM